MHVQTFLKNIIVGFGLIVLIASPVVVIGMGGSVKAEAPIECDARDDGGPVPEDCGSDDEAAAGADNQCSGGFLGIPPWYRGLVQLRDTDADGRAGECIIMSPEDAGGLSAFIWKVVLNVIQAALVIVGYIAFFFILYGGFQFLTGGANPGQIEKAKKTILNAVIGLAIALAAVGVVNLIFGILG